MPIYEYACRACGVETEIMHKISDPPVRKCPACGKLKLTKQVSAAGFRLGGGGWYETDFKKDGKRNLAGDKSDKSDKADKADKADKTEKTAVAKPAAAEAGKTEKKEPAKKEAAKTEPKKTPQAA